MDEELMEPVKEETHSKDSLCRLCASYTQLLIPIFEGEGLENSLSDKIEKYLPIQVGPSDVLPVQICFQCASTVLSWHELSESCIEAELKLKAMFGTNSDPQWSPGSGLRDADIYEDSASHSESFSGDNTATLSNNEMLSSDNQSETHKAIEEIGVVLSKGGETERLIADVTEDIDEMLCVQIKEEYNPSVTGCENQSQIDHCYTRGKENFSQNEVSQQEGRSQPLNRTTFRPIAPRPSLPQPVVNFVQSPPLSASLLRKPRVMNNSPEKRKTPPHIYIVYNKLGSAASPNPKSFIAPIANSNSNSQTIALMQSANSISERQSGPAKNLSVSVQPVLTVSQTPNTKSTRLGQPIFPKSYQSYLGRPRPSFPNLKEITVTRVPASGTLKSPVKNIPKASVSVIRGGSYACKQCPAKFTNEMVYKRHMYMSHNVPKHSCPYCKTNFGKKFDLELHVRQKHKKPETKPKVPCKDCNETFDKIIDLRVHIREKHRSVISRLEQTIASKKPVLGVPITEKEADLLRQCYSRVENKDVFNCVICSKSWPNLEKTVAHIRTHTKELLYACETCGQRFNTRGVMHRHMQVHSNSKPFSCNYCDKSFSSKQNRDDHHRYHTKEVKTVCESCGEFLTSASMLYYHRKIHSGINPYKCPYCEKAYSIKSLLKRHIRFHTGEKPYLCSECGRAFKTPGQLRGHQAVHSDARPFACDGCGTMMKTKKYLNRHKAICSHLKAKVVKNKN